MTDSERLDRIIELLEQSIRMAEESMRFARDGMADFVKDTPRRQAMIAHHVEVLRQSEKNRQ